MLQDIRFALRMLVKDRWLTVVAVLALGLGIGLNATVFTFVNAVLIRGLPFHHPEQIFHLNTRNTAASGTSGLSYLELEDLRAGSKTFSELAAYRPGSFTVTENGRPPERVQGASVSANTFSLLGQPTLFGRSFASGEDRPGTSPVVVLGYGIWQSRYGGDQNIVGRVINVDGVPSTVIGVMPERMKFPNNADLWRPLTPAGEDLTRRDHRTVNLFGRITPGATRRSASAEMSRLGDLFEEQYPDTNKNIDIALMTFNERFNGGPIRVVFLALMGAVGFVLLIACANVANLLLARSAQRAREVAVRVALGATRARIVRQLLIESVLLACIGGLFGLGLAHVSVRLFEAAVSDVGKPYWVVFTFDATVFGYFAAICLTTGIVFGLAPALQVSRTNVNEVLKEGGRGNSGTVRARRMASALVVTELMLTLVLLAGAGLMIRSFLKLYSFKLGIETSQMLTMGLQLPEQKYPTAEERRLFFDSLLTRVQSVPGVQSAAIASALPSGGSEGRSLKIEGRSVDRPEDSPRTARIIVSPSYFDVMSVSMRQGRGLRDTDGRPGEESVVVNERFATRFFPGEEVIGRRIRLVTRGRNPEPGPWLTIAGVSPTIRQGDEQQADPDPVVYQPYRLEAPGFMNLITRSATPPATLTAALREAVQGVDPDQPVFQVRTMDEFLARGRWPYRVFGTMFGSFAGLALILSALGIYAVTAYSVSQRRQEIGVRMALGAQPGQVSWLVLRTGLIQLGVGLAAGLALAWPLTTVLQSVVAQIPARDPVTFGVIVALLSLVMIAACVIPARRATRVDPLTALRTD